MKVGELIASRRRIGPMKAVDENGDAVTDFSAPGSKEISINDGAWAAAGGDVVAIDDTLGDPSGYVYYEATAPDAAQQGTASVKLTDVCIENTFSEDVEVAPQGIPVGTDDVDLLHAGPLRAVDENGAPILSAVGITVEISINGAQLEVPGNALAETPDEGYFDLPLDPSEATEVGWVFVRIYGGGCQEFAMRVDIVEPTLGGSEDSVDPTCEAFTPEGAIDVTDEIAVDVSDDLELAYIAAFVTYNDALPRIPVFRRGAFEPGFSVLSYTEDIAGPGVTTRLHIKPDSGQWPADTEIKITIDPVDGGGNVGA